MHRALFYSVLCASLVGGVACSKNRDTAAARPSVGDVARAGDKDHLEITGCLSASADGNQFVLTANSNALSSMANRAAAGEAETFHYQLVGGNDLQSMVGKEVKVVGAVVGKGKDVDVKAADPATVASKSAGADATPVVKTTEQVEMQVEQLNVSSVVATGSPCQVVGR